MISECQEFAPVALGDARLRQRLVTIATGLAAHPDGTLPQDCANWAELKAAYGPIPQPHRPAGFARGMPCPCSANHQDLEVNSSPRLLVRLCAVAKWLARDVSYSGVLYHINGELLPKLAKFGRAGEHIPSSSWLVHIAQFRLLSSSLVRPALRAVALRRM